jgi:hypothetical protein
MVGYERVSTARRGASGLGLQAQRAAPRQGHRRDAGHAKLDWLSRSAAFLLTLRDAGVTFAAVDLPEANDLTVGIIALVAQQEREAISKRWRRRAGSGWVIRTASTRSAVLAKVPATFRR